MYYQSKKWGWACLLNHFVWGMSYTMLNIIKFLIINFNGFDYVLTIGTYLIIINRSTTYTTIDIIYDDNNRCEYEIYKL